MTVTIINAHVLDGLAQLPDESVHCCVTSPPYYGLRSYGTEPQVWSGEPGCKHEWGTERVVTKGGSGQNKNLNNAPGYRDERDTKAQTLHQGSFCQKCGAWRGDLGLEPTPDLYLDHLVEVFREVRRALRNDGTCWLNIGDSYAGSGKGGNPVDGKQATNRGSQTIGTLYGKCGETERQAAVTNVTRKPVGGAKAKDLLLIPAQLSLRLRADGWWVRSEIVWVKRSPMPESVTDRPTCAHEKVFLLTKSARYFYDPEAVKEVADEASGWAKQRAAGVNTWRYNDTPERLACTGQRVESSTLGTAGKRNLRNVWHLGPEPFAEAHFATFPTEIPRRAILAGTSAKGVCPKCGATRMRMVERVKCIPGRSGGNTQYPHNVGHGRTMMRGGLAGGGSETLAWRASCSCDADESVPATVLDPFLGAGTTALVADQLGRHCIGIELSPQYAEIAETRLRADSGMFADIALTPITSREEHNAHTD